MQGPLHFSNALMKTENGKWRSLRIALLCGFAFSGLCSLHESRQIVTLAERASLLDQIAPHLGDAERADEHQHTLQLYPYTLIALCFAYCLYLTRKRKEKSEG
jgi:hypothetical protein